MSAKGERPREGVQKINWQLVRDKGKVNFAAWVAGPVVGVLIHRERKPKPCLTHYTGLKACPGCEKRLAIGWYGFQPLYRDPDHAPMLAAFMSTHLALLDLLDHRDPVTIGREDGPGNGMWIRRNLKGEKLQTAIPERKSEQCCAWILPQIFGLVGRISGEQILHGKFDGPPVPVATKTKKEKASTEIDENDPDVKLLRKAQSRGGVGGSLHPDGMYPMTDTLADGRVVMRQGPSSNGNGKH